MTHPVDLGTCFGGQYGTTGAISVMIRDYHRLSTQTATSKNFGYKDQASGLDDRFFPLRHPNMTSTSLPPQTIPVSLDTLAKQDTETGIPDEDIVDIVAEKRYVSLVLFLHEYGVTYDLDCLAGSIFESFLVSR